MRDGRALTWLLLAVLAATIGVASLPRFEQHDHRLCGEGVGIRSLKAISSAQAIFQWKDSEGDGTLDYGSLRELSDEHLIDPVLGSGTTGGFVISVTAAEFTWSAQASPEDPQRGFRYFYIDQTGVIRFTHAIPARPRRPSWTQGLLRAPLRTPGHVSDSQQDGTQPAESPQTLGRVRQPLAHRER